MEGIPTPVEAGILSHWQIYTIVGRCCGCLGTKAPNGCTKRGSTYDVSRKSYMETGDSKVASSCISFFVWIILWNKNMSLKCLWSIHQKISRVVNRMWVWVKTGLKGFCNGNLNCWKIRRVAGHWWLSSIHGNKNRSPLDWQCFFLKHGFSGQLC